MKKIQMASLLLVLFVWMSTCGFASLGETATGITDIVESMTVELLKKAEEIQAWENRCMPNVKE